MARCWLELWTYQSLIIIQLNYKSFPIKNHSVVTMAVGSAFHFFLALLVEGVPVVEGLLVDLADRIYCFCFLDVLVCKLKHTIVSKREGFR